MSIVWSGPRLTRYQRAASTPISSSSSSRKTTLPARFDAFAVAPPPRQMDELVEQHLDALRVVAEHPRDRRVPARGRVVVGPEHVDRAVEAALELVDEVGDVGGTIGRHAALGLPTGRAPSPARRRRPTSVPTPRRPSRRCRAAGAAPAGAARACSAAPSRRSGSGSAPSSPRSSGASRRPGRRRRPARARRRTPRGSRPPAPARRAAAPRRTRGSARSACRRRCSSTRARPASPANASSRATESPSAPFRPADTTTGPVGLADTISTCTRAGGFAKPPP